MEVEELSSIQVCKFTKELHELLSESDMSHIELQFQVKQVLRQGVTYEEFIEIIRDVVPSSQAIPAEHLKSIFTKIDTRSSGQIDWNGFISYVLTALQRDEAAGFGVEIALQSTYRMIKGPQHDVIRRIDLMPQINTTTDEVSYASCRYVTASKDGVIAVWSQKMKLQKFKMCRNQSAMNTKVFPWILDMVCIPNAQMIATCSTDETIRFYDVINANMDLLISITTLESVATCLSFWFDPFDLEHSVLVFGDTLGRVTYLDFDKSVSQRLFGLQTGYGERKLKLSDLLKKQIKHITGIQYNRLHDEWVRQVKYASGLKSILSCSVSSTISMIVCGTFFDLGNKIFVVQKGISSFDYSIAHNVIITGSIDRCLRIWNPYLNKKPVATLSGHNAPVMHVIIINDKFQAISISEDKCIKVWDLKELTCIQTIYDRFLKWGSYGITAAVHDSAHRLLLLGSMKMITIEQIWQRESTDKTIFTSHSNALLGVEYSRIYGYVVSASDTGSISFWDLETGKKVVHISKAHSAHVDGADVSMAITAMTLDENGRRLITAGGDGRLKMWSMNNGSFIKSINLPEGKDINSILACKKRIYFGGWTKRVYVCNDEMHLDTMRTWPLHHNDDIMDICYVVPNHIATASWDGKIMIWALESGQHLSVCSMQHHEKSDRVLTKKVRKRPLTTSAQTNLSLDVSFPALNCMVTLLTRNERPSVGNVLVGDVDGFVQVWSVARTGGLLCLFGNVSVFEHYTSCMTTDDENKYLFTGDTYGFIRVWYIKNFYSGEAQLSSGTRSQDIKPFPFSKKNLQPAHDRVMNELRNLQPKPHLQFIRTEYPQLISSYRGHLKTIVQISLIENKKLTLTACKDRSVRIWTYSGAYLRTLGDTREWSLKSTLAQPVRPMDRKVPPDITKVVSGPTLQVILQGLSPQWYRLREVILRTYVKSLGRKKASLVLQSGSEETTATCAYATTPAAPASSQALAAPAPYDRKKTTTFDSDRMQEQELVFWKMGAPLGNNFVCKQVKRQKPPLPAKANIYKEMNCVYAFLEAQALGPISLEPLFKYLDTHRYAARLKMSKYEHIKTLGLF